MDKRKSAIGWPAVLATIISSGIFPGDRLFPALQVLRFRAQAAHLLHHCRTCHDYSISRGCPTYRTKCAVYIQHLVLITPEPHGPRAQLRFKQLLARTLHHSARHAISRDNAAARVQPQRRQNEEKPCRIAGRMLLGTVCESVDTAW